MCNLENYDPNDVPRPSAPPTDRRLFLAGALALPLATVLTNVELVEAQAAKGVSFNQRQMAARSATNLPDRLPNDGFCQLKLHFGTIFVI